MESRSTWDATCRSRTVTAEESIRDTMAYRHVILDRDGVLNREAHGAGYILEPAEFVWVPGALEALAMLRRAGLYLSVATNQSGVGRGLMSLAQLEAVHERMRTEAAQNGAALDAVLFCPHAPDDRCACRKPEPGLIREAIARSGIAAADSIVVGDDQRDLEAAARAGVRAALVRTGKGRKTEALNGTKVPTYDDLPELARALLRQPTSVE
jgi:D-glycero-D-manno-heptose 1,7-bisphosphate phosphatase